MIWTSFQARHVRFDGWTIKAVDRTDADTGEPAGFWVAIPPTDSAVKRNPRSGFLQALCHGRLHRNRRWHTAEAAMKAIDKEHPLSNPFPNESNLR